MASGSDAAPPRRGEYILFEPVHPDRPDGPWVARRDGAVQLEALELLQPGQSWNRPGIRRFTHPRLVSLIDRFAVDGSSAQVTELVLGVSLERVLRVLAEKSIPIPLSVVGQWADELLQGLLHLEQSSSEAGVPLHLRHSNVSAARVQVDVWGSLKLGDYELLQAQKDSGDLRTGGSAITEVPFPNTDGLEFVNLVHEILTLHPASDDGADRPDAPGLAAQIRLWSREAAVPPSGIAGRWQQLRAHLPAADPEAAADWLRRSVPDLEAQTLARLERVRVVTERHRPPERLAITEPEPDLSSWVPPEPLEPSVMTMPGVLLQPGRVAASRVDSRSVKQRAKSRSRSRSGSKGSKSRRGPTRKLAFAGLIGLAALLAGVAAYRLSSEVRAPTSVPLVQAEPNPPLRSLTEPRPQERQAAPEVRELPGAEPDAAPSEKAASKRLPRRRPAPSRTRSAPAPDAEPTSPEPAPARAPTPEQPTQDPAIRAVRAALAAPEDKVLFEEALQALRRSAARLPDDRRAPVEAAIQRAEFSWRARDLSRAMERLQRN